MIAHALREWARVWEALAGLPKMRAAVLSSEISWSVARRAVAHASPETEEAFAEALRGRTLCAAEAMLRAAATPACHGEILNVGDDRPSTFRDLAETICGAVAGAFGTSPAFAARSDGVVT